MPDVLRSLLGPGDVRAAGLFGAALLAAVAAGEALRAAGWRPEATRRFVHAAVGVMVALAPPLFAQPTAIYVLALAFGAVNIAAVRRRWLPAMHGVERVSWGTVTFPLALVVGLALTWSVDPARTFALRAAFLVLALADPLAAIVGTHLPRPGRYTVAGHEKSLAGSAAFFVAAVVLATFAFVIWAPPGLGLSLGQGVGLAVVAAGLATEAEALGTRGWDNLGIVLAVLVPPVFFLDPPLPSASYPLMPDTLSPQVLALAGAAAFGLVAHRLRFLDLSGALTAGLLAWGVLLTTSAAGGGTVAWLVPAFLFFFLTSALSKLGGRRKRPAERLAEKSSRRDAGQVLANGGVAAAFLLAHLLLGDGLAVSEAFYWGYVGAFAASAADTWATEIGTLVRGRTWSVFSRERVEPGTSGGVSLAGTAGALAGAAAVFIAALPFAAPAPPGAGTLALLVIGTALLAALADSALGATVQARYRDAGGALTERATEGGRALPLVRGHRGWNNDRVNLVATLIGGLGPFLAVLAAGRLD